MDYFWGELNGNELEVIKNKNLIIINYLSIIIPDILYLIKYRKDINIPKAYLVNINLIRRLIYLVLWYWGYFYRMGMIVKPKSLYESIYHLQLLTWSGSNILPLIKKNSYHINILYYWITTINFVLFSGMKIWFCKDSGIFKFALIGMGTSLLSGFYSGLGLFQRICVYNLIHTNPKVM